MIVIHPFLEGRIDAIERGIIVPIIIGNGYITVGSDIKPIKYSQFKRGVRKILYSDKSYDIDHITEIENAEIQHGMQLSSMQ